jgi:amino acid adenylation domain-containing protein
MAFTPFPRAALEASIGERFESQVRRGPDRLAVKFGDAAWTYAALDAAANRVAHAILAARGPGEAPVALVLEQGVWQVAAILGALKAGKIYVPLDPAAPAARLAPLLAEAGAALVVASAATLPRAAEAAGAVPVLDAGALADDPPRAAPGVRVPPDAGAYVYYTSGSTGRAKGVLDSHRNVLHNVMRYTNSLEIGATDRLTLLQGPAFSGAVSSLFAALLNGAACFPFDVPRQGAHEIAGWLRREAITIYHSVPSLFREVARSPGPFPALRLIRLEGDRASARDVELFQAGRFAESCRLVNGLGATECGLVRQYFVGRDTPAPSGVVPIGYPVEDMEVRVLDDAGGAVATGEVGEIAVCSRYLAVGYWRRPDLTAAAFAADPAGDGARVYRTGDLGRLRPDGCLEHLGRKAMDGKVRGVRVDIAAVEAALLTVAGVKEAAAAVRPADGDDTRLVAYVVPAVRPAPTVSALRRHLAARLPDGLVPSRYVVLDALPLDANGKVDRRGLPDADTARPALDGPLVPPENLLEQQLAAVWETVLDVRPIGIRDDFFDLGGHSLLAVRMMDEVERAIGRAAPLAALVPEATIERLAEALQRDATDLAAPVVTVQSDGRRPPLFFLHGDYLSGGFFAMGMARQLGPDQPVYALPPMGLDGRPVPASYAMMAAEHVAAMRTVQARGPYYLGGLCNGGLIAYEMARLLEQQGETVARLLLVGAIIPRGTPGWLRALARGVSGSPAAWLPEGGPPGSLPALRRSLRETYLRLEAAYAPGRFGGRVDLLWPADDPVPSTEAARRWRPVARAVDVHTVPGTHVTCLTTEVALTAAVLRRCLDEDGDGATA